MSVELPDGYEPSDNEEFMNELQLKYFYDKLVEWKKEIVEDSRETLTHLQEDSLKEEDIADRASAETDWSVELRTRYRQRKLILKIDAAIQRIKNKEYGLIKKYNWWFVRLNLVSAKLIHYKLNIPLVKFIKGLTEKPNNKKIQNEKYYDLAKDNFQIVFENYLGVLEKLINLADKHNTKVIFLVQSQGTDTKKNIFLTSFSQKAKKKSK